MPSVAKIYQFSLLIGAVLLLAACGGGTGGPPPPKDGRLPTGNQGGIEKVGKPYKINGTWYHPARDPHYDETGSASWYGPDFHGKLTANGETYNMNALTAAHRTLPMPSFVKVTNLENGRNIVLRVNDRGPFAKGRIIDVSRRAAQLLGFERQGVTRVRVQASDGNGKTLAKRREDRQGPREVADAGSHFIQIGSFRDRGNAIDQRERVKDKGHKARIVGANTPRGQFWRVQVGPFDDRPDAEKALDRLVSNGFYEARIFRSPN